MPNSYHYFESGEVSDERWLLEIELLKELKKCNLLDSIDWSLYDTQALKIFLQVGIEEVNEELRKRYRTNLKKFERCNFISECIRKYEKFPLEENFKRQHTSSIMILNLIFSFICILFVMGIFIYEYSLNDLAKPPAYPLTAKKRHLSFKDDLSIILLTFISGIILGCLILSMRFNRKIILFGIILMFLVVILVIRKTHQIVKYLSTYREIRWPMLYDYMFS